MSAGKHIEIPIRNSIDLHDPMFDHPIQHHRIIQEMIILEGINERVLDLVLDLHDPMFLYPPDELTTTNQYAPNLEAIAEHEIDANDLMLLGVTAPETSIRAKDSPFMM